MQHISGGALYKPPIFIENACKFAKFGESIRKIRETAKIGKIPKNSPNS
jgi:hypothetical protein